MKRVALFISCDSFEGFYGGTFGLNRETYLTSYRNDFVWEYAEGLKRCGHYVIIYILSYGEPELRPVSDGLGVRFLPLPLWLRVLDPIMYRLRDTPTGAVLRARLAYLAYGASLQAALLEDRIDVIYHQEIWTPRFDIIAGKSKVPVVGADQGAVYQDWMAPAKRVSMKQASRVMCQSAIALDRVRDFGGEAVIMYNGVDTDFFSPPTSAEPRPKTVLAVGRLVDEQKRFSDLLRAMQLLPDFHLILVGGGPHEAKLKQLAKELGVSGRVTFTGFVTDRAELRRLYQECGAFVSTSSWEAVALVVLEAMSCAAPIVATRIPSFEDLITDGTDGLLVPVGAPEEVARSIRIVQERSWEFGNNARNTVVERYASRTLYSRLSALFETI
jgi:glycosyltransferase involved in cell wall biosynthesis